MEFSTELSGTGPGAKEGTARPPREVDVGSVGVSLPVTCSGGWWGGGVAGKRQAGRWKG